MVDIHLENLTKIYPGKRRTLLQRTKGIFFRRKDQDVEKEEKDIVAVDHVTLTVEDSKYFTILGPSGSGKSTTLGLIAGHIEPTEGKIIWDGTDITAASDETRPRGQQRVCRPHRSWGLDPVVALVPTRGPGHRTQPNHQSRRPVTTPPG